MIIVGRPQLSSRRSREYLVSQRRINIWLSRYVNKAGPPSASTLNVGSRKSASVVGNRRRAVRKHGAESLGVGRLRGAVLTPTWPGQATRPLAQFLLYGA